ncbi:serine endopeptidase [Massilia norwichensis]|uniref:Serine endopeptidase n=1 Tax=Massilia norwichensis TaxID=1442366 RepID=A0ABT2A3N5_9BURK|nr:serine endopeptidase [Massilia norwichensis]MCS0588797.1 serine endopeptidase [Massilia norwichensis]
MNKGLRLTETWMRRALWLVAFVFAAFLIGLGSQVIDNLAYFEPAPSAESLVDPAKAAPLQAAIAQAGRTRESAGQALEQAQHQHEVAAAKTRSARQAFDNWLATRHTTARPDQDAELIGRTRELDKLVAAEHEALEAVQAQQQVLLDAAQAEKRADSAYENLLEPARTLAREQAERQARTVFLLRIGVTVPLLGLAAWLFRNKRNGTYWPFTWGFIFFALFAFFVELVPYLPSYGGYVRYGVGIFLTIVVGRYAIRWLQAWLERQKAAEALPEQERRTTMRYDLAMDRIGKGLCPSCERPTNFKDKTLAHCPHCGIGLFDRCTACRTRKNAFTRFCFSCGTPAKLSLAD